MLKTLPVRSQEEVRNMTERVYVLGITYIVINKSSVEIQTLKVLLVRAQTEMRIMLLEIPVIEWQRT